MAITRHAEKKLVALTLVVGLLAAGCVSGAKSQKRDLEKDPHYHYRWAMEQSRKGYYMEALESINKAITLDAEMYQYYNLRGLIYHAAGEYDLALADLHKVLEINPYYTDAHNNLGATLMEMGQVDEAQNEFEQVLRDPAYQFKEKAYYNLGNLYYSQEKLTLAVEQFRKAIAIHPDYLKAYYKLGMSLRTLGETEGALHAFNEVVRIAPKSNEAREVKLIIQSSGATS